MSVTFFTQYLGQCVRIGVQCVVYVARPPVEGEVRLARGGERAALGEGEGGSWRGRVSEWILLP